ncbi:mannitol dehydrogenase family protein [Saccharothrix sp. S26]|uniref:mannitol dehydrogenase family protein n=1 Tax=Saccharothrix sp. S26 TaxID=2907215 RepID=UPI001F27370D|nr:mannitol dehydrogenase family protein [Saccharothrix sp. S26]MCE6997122.1 mannitol dehydrogenase family protein [Saccharothrix sp. S26]
MSHPRLSASRLPAWLAADLPDGGVGIVHLGLGAFHRAHQAVLTQEAMRVEPGPWGICAVAQRNGRLVDALVEQDHLFTVTERGPEDDRLRVVGSVREALLAPEQPDRVAAVLAEPGTRVVTVTVTESGYRHDPATGRLRVEDPDVAADLAGGPPRTPVGQLVGGLRRRRLLGNPGLTVVSCDNLPDNGRLVARLTREFCAHRGEHDLVEWVDEHVRFPSSVVDQIVPATTAADVAHVAEALGLEDRAAVVGEPHRRWVIEDDFAAGRPAWDAVGVDLVPDIAPHQAAKLRLVNGTHTALAHLGLLAGCTSTADALARPEFARFAERLLRAETGPSLRRFGLGPDEREIEGLLTRLANPRLGHRLDQIAADALRKVPQRLLDPAVDLLVAGIEPRLISLAVAGLLHQQDFPVLALPLPLRESRVFRSLLADAVRRIDQDGVVVTLRRIGRS